MSILYQEHIDPEGSETFNFKRIVSVVPSQTELLFDLGLSTEVVGITKFCIHPKKWQKEKEIIGGTKKLNIPKILSLSPDLILANKEENEKEQIEELAKVCTTFVSDVHNLASSLTMINAIGKLTNMQPQAIKIVNNIEASFIELTKKEVTRVAYLIWKDPYMSVGGDTFINDMLSYCGFENVYKNKNRYPVVSMESLIEKKPEVILLSSEPYPFKHKHVAEMQAVFNGTKVLTVDGELFSWYGSSLLKSPDYFNSLKNHPLVTGR